MRAILKSYYSIYPNSHNAKVVDSNCLKMKKIE